MSKSKNQVIVPPPVEVKETTLQQNESETYLLQAGWTLHSRNQRGESYWVDPAGSDKPRGVETPTVKVEGRDGADPSFISQVICPPSRWTYSLFDAVDIQRKRDAVAKAS